MKKIDIIYVKKYYEKLCGLCNMLDRNGLWNSPEFAGSSLKEIFRHNIGEFLLYLAASDLNISDEEAYMYNEITGFSGDKEKMAQYINDNDIYSCSFESEVPLIFRLIRECENNEIQNKKKVNVNLNKSYSELFAEFFLLLANVFIEVDDEVAIPEMEDSNIYMNTIRKYISENENSASDYYNMIDKLIFTSM